MPRPNVKPFSLDSITEELRVELENGNKNIERMTSRCCAALKGNTPFLQGFVLADLLAKHLAGYDAETEEDREKLVALIINLHLELVESLVKSYREETQCQKQERLPS